MRSNIFAFSFGPGSHTPFNAATPLPSHPPRKGAKSNLYSLSTLSPLPSFCDCCPDANPLHRPLLNTSWKPKQPVITSLIRFSTFSLPHHLPPRSQGSSPLPPFSFYSPVPSFCDTPRPPSPFRTIPPSHLPQIRSPSHCHHLHLRMPLPRFYTCTRLPHFLSSWLDSVASANLSLIDSASPGLRSIFCTVHPHRTRRRNIRNYSPDRLPTLSHSTYLQPATPTISIVHHFS